MFGEVRGFLYYRSKEEITCIVAAELSNSSLLSWCNIVRYLTSARSHLDHRISTTPFYTLSDVIALVREGDDAVGQMKLVNEYDSL
jgi:hypothetical protein